MSLWSLLDVIVTGEVSYKSLSLDQSQDSINTPSPWVTKKHPYGPLDWGFLDWLAEKASISGTGLQQRAWREAAFICTHPCMQAGTMCAAM